MIKPLLSGLALVTLCACAEQSAPSNYLCDETLSASIVEYNDEEARRYRAYKYYLRNQKFNQKQQNKITNEQRKEVDSQNISSSSDSSIDDMTPNTPARSPF